MKKQQQAEVDLLWIKLLSTNCLSFNINLGTKIAINLCEASIYCVHSNTEWDVCQASGLWLDWALSEEVCQKIGKNASRQKRDYSSRYYYICVYH